MKLTPTEGEVLTLLRRADAPLRFSDFTTTAEASEASISRALTSLVENGLVERTGVRKTARYRPRRFLQATWQDELLDLRGRPRWTYREWESDDIDWRFPLVSAVPDRHARASLNAFFGLAFDRGYLTPWLAFGEADYPGPADDEVAQRRFTNRIRNRSDHDYQFIVYGSCARGDARPDSDVDTALLVNEADGDHFRSTYQKRFIDLVYDLGKTPRRISLLVLDDDLSRDTMKNPYLFDAIAKEGISVCASRPSHETPHPGAEDDASTLTDLP